jgi:hypothetical protein
MDRKPKKDWGWLPTAMPGVARLMAERRAEMGNEHVNECWKRSVVELQPGWLFAREGALAVGTPWEHGDIQNFAAARVTDTQALLVIREPEASNGTH